jgi:hypothetical protein
MARFETRNRICWPLRQWAWIACGTGLAVSLGCSSEQASSTQQAHHARPMCGEAADCVSGSCRGGVCAVCELVDFELDSSERPITNGQVVELAYAPLQIGVLRDRLTANTRGLGVALNAGDPNTEPHLRFPSQGNVLISQKSFNAQDVLRGFVDQPRSDPDGASFDFRFPEPICAESLTLLDIDRREKASVSLYGASNHRLARIPVHGRGQIQTVLLGSRCDVSRMSVSLSGSGAVDDVRVCGLGRGVIGASSGPGRECGVDVLGGVPGGEAVDPCIEGTITARARLHPWERQKQIAFSVPEDASVCVRLSGKASRASRLELDGEQLVDRAGQEWRATPDAGAHTLTVHAAPGSPDLLVDVLVSSGVFDPRGAVERDGLLVTSPDETPDVLTPGDRVALSALVRAAVHHGAHGPHRHHSPSLKASFNFRIYRPGSCSRVATVSGHERIRPGEPTLIGASWDGKDDLGRMLPDGDYLWNVEVGLSKLHHRHLRKLAKVTTGFRRLRIFGRTSKEDCQAQIREAVAAAGLSDPNSRFDVIRNLLRCGADTPTACEIDYFALLNVQRRAMADRILADQITPAEYLQFQFDRSRKIAIADADPSWLVDFCRGDADRDLVPDRRDQCPDTPPLTATDDVGCTDPNLPPAPSREDVQTVLANMHFSAVPAPGCPKNGIPEPSEVISACEAEPNRLRITVRPENSLPPECPVWYELRGQAAAAVVFHPFQIEEPFIAALGPPMASTSVPGGIEFEITPELLGGRWLELVEQGIFLDWLALRLTVQTISAAGKRSIDGPMPEIEVSRCP